MFLSLRLFVPASDSESLAAFVWSWSSLLPFLVCNFRFPLVAVFEAPIVSPCSSISFSLADASASSSLFTVSEQQNQVSKRIFKIFLWNQSMRFEKNRSSAYLLCRFVHFCGFTGATVADGRFGGAFVVAVTVALGWVSFFFTRGCGLATLSDDSESVLLFEEPEEPDPAEQLLELAELSDFCGCADFANKPDTTNLLL